MESSPSFVRQPECNRCVERFIRTLKEQLLWVKIFQNVEELRCALAEFRELYNQRWIVQRLDYLSPPRRAGSSLPSEQLHEYPQFSVQKIRRKTNMLKVEEFETELKRLVAETPIGTDLWLDSYRKRGSHGSGCSTIINRQVRAFLLYRGYVETGTRFLDWGCRHAWASCMVRMVNTQAKIEGCDINETMPENTRNFAGMGYTRLKHTWRLPYPDNAFDRIICCGVLEHVPLLNSSLLELNRVTEPGGYLLITFLPNKFSYTEFLSRNLFKSSWHRRLYTKARLETKLLEHGFEPINVGFHQFLPSLTSGNYLRWPWAEKPIQAIFKLDPLAERIWPLKLFAANLYAIARKCDYF